MKHAFEPNRLCLLQQLLAVNVTLKAHSHRAKANFSVCFSFILAFFYFRSGYIYCWIGTQLGCLDSGFSKCRVEHIVNGNI